FAVPVDAIGAAAVATPGDRRTATAISAATRAAPQRRARVRHYSGSAGERRNRLGRGTLHGHRVAGAGPEVHHVRVARLTARSAQRRRCVVDLWIRPPRLEVLEPDTV